MNLQRDGFMLALLAVMIFMLGAAVAGAYRVFGFALVTFIGMMAGLAFVRKGDPVTWVPAVTATAVLLAAFVGLFVYESAPVDSPADTLLGFQKGTAFVIYGVWIPAFFTMGVGFALVFERLSAADDERERREARR